ncbi:hypothetical protein [Polyangium sp. 15x6]|uniref:hypothetical protein n=1 Tax=Polyangium sp. 15x6 TaxID=3042687 RepID=UPI00249B9A60|nr:hypothetical protein [Polyangium sp. 15x6]MDI3284884.1 hypothetical protein [Polyangium sp. 15x6]
MGTRRVGLPEGTDLPPQCNQLPDGDPKPLFRFLSFLRALVLLREKPPLDVFELESDGERKQHSNQG